MSSSAHWMEQPRGGDGRFQEEPGARSRFTRDFSNQRVRLNTPLAGAINFHGSNLSSQKLPLRTSIPNSDFSKAKASYVNFGQGNYRGSDFRGADLSGCNFSGCDLRDCDFTDANLEYADLRYAKTENAVFDKANLHAAKLSNMNAPNSSFSHANCQSADFKRSNLDEADFSNAFCKWADFRDAHIDGIVLTDTNLYGAKTDRAVGTPYQPPKTAEQRAYEQGVQAGYDEGYDDGYGHGSGAGYAAGAADMGKATVRTTIGAGLLGWALGGRKKRR